MALLDRPLLASAAEMVEDRLGIAVRPRAEYQRLAELETEFATFRDEAEELALHALDYWGGRPTELQREARKRLAQRSRWALLQDPIAQGQALLLANFAFGKGIGKPRAKEDKVQEVLDDAFDNTNNRQKLTGFFAQRRLSNELLTSGELFVTLYRRGGYVRVGRLDPDTVEAVVPDPVDRLRPLYYVTRERRFKWNVATDSADIQDIVGGTGTPKVKYWPDYQNLEEAEREREFDGVATDDDDALPVIPPEKQADGVVCHIAINQTGEQLRGNPPWAAQLRFFSALNVLTEAHIAMAQAASTFIARRAMTGTQSQVTKAASAVVSYASELGAGRLRSRDPGLEAERPPVPGEPRRFAPGQPPPFAPGSWWNDNQSSKLEALNLSSGAGQMAQTRQIVAAPVAAASQFGQHWQGDASNANLSTATTLEIQSMANVGAWQEIFETLLRVLADESIQEAVKAGRLGAGTTSQDGARPLSELRLSEAEERRELEERLAPEGKDKLDLDYEFHMPYPGRRPLEEVRATVVDVAAGYDPTGKNWPLRERLLDFFCTNTLELDDPAAAVEEIIAAAKAGASMGTPTPPPMVPGAPPPQVGPDGKPIEQTSNPQGVPNAYGARTAGQAPQDAQQEAWLPDDLLAPTAEFSQSTAALFRQLVSDPATLAAAGLGANGDGG